MTKNYSGPYFWLVRAISLLVPRRFRGGWKREWEAELRTRESQLGQWRRLNLAAKLELLKRSSGAMRDAIYLQPRRLEEDMFQDLQYGIRMLFKKPGFTVVAVLALALGIGANTAIFSVADKLLLRKLPVAQPDQLVIFANQDGPESSFSYQLYKDLRDGAGVFSGLIAYSPNTMNLSAGNQPERVAGEIVTGNFFDVLGVKPIVGRAFLPEEDSTPSTHPVAMLSYELWRRRFGADPSIIGRSILLNSHPFTVIGITPVEFAGLDRGYLPEIYVPMMMEAEAMPTFTGALNERGVTWLNIMGRLKPSVNREQAQAQLQVTSEQIARATGDKNASKNLVLRLGGSGGDYRLQGVSRPLVILMIAAALILLIACSNVANLLLTRASIRRKEIAIRLAVGAGRGRIVRQLLTESALLLLLGGAAGLVIAKYLTDFLISFQPPTGLSVRAGLDLRTLGFSLLVSVLTGIIFGLAPALRTSKPDLLDALKSETAPMGRHRRLHLRNGLVVIQVALSLVVLIVAGLCARSLQKLMAIDTGFDPARVLVMSIDPTLNGYKREQARQFYTNIVERVSSLPGVESVSVAGLVPLTDRSFRFPVTIEGRTPRPGEPPLFFNVNIVGLNYFRTMGIPILRGRDFTEEDRENGPRVIIISEAVASQFFPNQDPIGKHLSYVGLNVEIVGVAKDSKYRNLTEGPAQTMFLPLTQNFIPSLVLHIRAKSDPNQLVAAVRGEVHKLDPNLPIYGFRTLAEQKSNSLYASRMAAMLLGLFGLLALILSTIGIYGVLAYAVAQRTQEIGIRIAMGAQRRNVLGLVVGQGMALTAIGISIGLVGAIALTRVITSFLYGISATDPITYAGIAALLSAVALFACYIPARRAMRVDPMIALRYE